MIRVTIDAACNGAPLGEAGLAAVIQYQNETIEVSKYLEGPMNNHQAEFEACLFAFDELIARQWVNDVLAIYTDSQVLVQALDRLSAKGAWQQGYIAQLKDYCAQFTLVMAMHRSDSYNKRADQLAKAALHNRK